MKTRVTPITIIGASVCIRLVVRNTHAAIGSGLCVVFISDERIRVQT